MVAVGSCRRFPMQGWKHMGRGSRDELLVRLAERIDSVAVSHPVRVAIDGRPAAGKTTLADELGVALRGQGREVIRSTIEGFLLPRSVRYRRGEDSPEGCYEDSFNFDALHHVLLDPLGPDGDRRFRLAVYDRDTDAALSAPVEEAAADTVLLFDGVFLLRPELIDRWDLRIFVAAEFGETLARARLRDVASLGSPARVEERFRNRYLPSQQYYFETVRPTELADVVVHNDTPQQPEWLFRGSDPAVASVVGPTV